MKGDQPYLNPVGINIPEFKKLWNADKSKEKSQYAKELAYVYHMCDYDSPYYDMANKQEEVSKAFIGKANYNPPKRVENCIDIYKKMQYSAERRALDTAISLSDSLTNLAKQNETDTKQMNEILSGYDQEINESEDAFTKLAMLKEKLEIRKQAIDLANASTTLIDKMGKGIDSLVNLRIKVIQASYQDVDNHNRIENFLIDDLIEE
jgi:hypothetical protein